MHNDSVFCVINNGSVLSAMNKNESIFFFFFLSSLCVGTWYQQVKKASDYTVGLQLSGHTHGGQVFPYHVLAYLDQVGTAHVPVVRFECRR